MPTNVPGDDKFVPVTEESAKNWLINRADLKDVESTDPQEIWSQARIWVTQQEWLLKTVIHLYEELKRLKRYSLIPGWENCDLGSIDSFVGFEHELLGRPSAEAKFSEDEKEVWISVYFLSKHWKGEEARAYAQPVTHAMGFIVSVGDFWTTGRGCETPYRRCLGRNCGEELKLLDGENRRLFELLERARHAEAILLQKLEDVGHPVTKEDLMEMVITLPLEGEENGESNNQAT
jgi:hypothetical protein